MYCKYCKDEREEKTRVHAWKLVTLSCGHTITFNEVAESIKKIDTSVNFIPTPEDIKVFMSKDSRVPYPFQKDGMEFAKTSDFRCLIADEMGLGKTIQALGVLYHNPELYPALIVVKSALKMQWFAEVYRWLDIVPQLVGDSKAIPVRGFKVTITTYDILRKFTTYTKEHKTSEFGMEYDIETPSNPFYDLPYNLIILDEAQSIKNAKSKRSQEIARLCKDRPHIIGLSGTAIKNHAGEYGPILSILRPDIFRSPEEYVKRWVNTKATYYGLKPGALKNPELFHDRTRDFIIRRTRDEVDIQFPELNRIFFHVDFENEKLRKQYEAEENAIVKELEDNVGKAGVPANILGLIARARHLVAISKIPSVVEQLAEHLMSNDRKIVVFTHHLDVMETIYLQTKILCLEGGFNEPLLYRGSGDNENINKFRNNPADRILIASTISAGEGLNLQFCSDCIFVERQWNPANEEQAEGRFIRINATANRVNATYMIVSDSIDEYLTELVEKKREIMRSTLDGVDIPYTEESLMSELLRVMATKSRKRVQKGW